MAEMTNYEDVMVEETELDQVDSGDSKDLSTLIGVGIIAGGGVVVYEGGKRVVKLVKTKVAPAIGKHLPWRKKAEAEAAPDAPPAQAESPQSEEKVEAK